MVGLQIVFQVQINFRDALSTKEKDKCIKSLYIYVNSFFLLIFYISILTYFIDKIRQKEEAECSENIVFKNSFY